MSTKQKVKVPVPDDWTDWEVHLFEKEVGFRLSALNEYRQSDKPWAIVEIALKWITLRRQDPTITIERVGSGPFELDMTLWIEAEQARRAAEETDETEEDEEDPFDQSPTESNGDEPGKQSSE